MSIPVKSARSTRPTRDCSCLVATDRVSAYDHVLVTPIPDKGKILTSSRGGGSISSPTWCPTTLVAADIPAEFAAARWPAGSWRWFRWSASPAGYLTGSALAEYQHTGAVCGVALPAGLVEASKLPEPVFTPATKAPRGEHDENISIPTVAATVGADLADPVGAHHPGGVPARRRHLPAGRPARGRHED